MLLKVKQAQGKARGNKYIHWALLFPEPDGWKLTICYTGDKPNDDLMFKTDEEASDFVNKLAEEHGQEEVMIICWKKDPNRASNEEG